jgi:hypothetical protein
LAFHVDIIKTEPMAGTERLLARVVVEHGHVVIDSPDEAYWRDALTRAVDLDPDEDPEAFLQALSERLDGTYVFATEPHDESDCEHAAEPTLESAPA